MTRTAAHWIIATALLASCSGEQATTPAAEEPSSGGEPASGPTSSMDRKMWHHFWDVADARDAVVAGDVPGARAALMRIAADTYGVREAPHDWLPWIEEMQAEARRGEQAKTLEDAASVVAGVAQRCGECHRATRGGPEVADDELQSYDPHGRTGLRGAMAQHVWASEELWLGMTVPHHQSWVAGAKALSETPAPPVQGEQAEGDAAPAANGGEAAAPASAPAEGAVDAAMADQLEAVRALGSQALEAGQPAQMARVYGEMIARCGHCHASSRK